MSLSSFFGVVQKDEKWVIAEVQKGWAEIQSGVKTATVDLKGIFDYIAAHQTQIDQTAQAILGDVSMVAALAGHPEVGAVAATVSASAQAITNLAAGIDKGTVPLSGVVSALHGVKDAQSAVNALVKLATAAPPPAAS